MRRGRALLPHPQSFQDDTGRWLGTRQVVAKVTGRHPDLIRKRVPVVACHIPSGCLLVDFDDVERVLAGVPQRPGRRKAES